jgi:hypothetical protein
LGGDIDDRGLVLDGDGLGDAADGEREVDELRLADGEGDTGAALVAEAAGFGGDGVGANGTEGAE